MISCSIGIMAYNEENNIGRLLEALLHQDLNLCHIIEIIVVASGCTDRTEDVVKRYSQSNDKIKLLVQKRREGKASAINLFFSVARGDILVLESGDTLPEKNTIENLIRPFTNPGIGMTGGHPIPINSSHNFMGFTVNLLWKLHHYMALQNPKLGELVAFRNIIKEIPADTAVDEASIEALITAAGYKLYYAWDAIVRNKGAENIGDFLRQRRRIAAGHKHLQKTQGHTVSTKNVIPIFLLLIRNFEWKVRFLLWTMGAISLEFLGRTLGYYDFYIKKRNPFNWEVAVSTKDLKID